MDRKIKYAIDTHGMGEAYGRVIIGFSGGADSSLLLHYFKKRSKEVVCVHVNHMIRGEEAERDQLFCERICKKYGVELVTHKIDIPALSRERGKGVEETARDERYRVFYEELEKRSFDAILTAHNGDDNCESVIFNISRGTGLNGLCGIKPKNGRVLRPLIYLSKDEIFSLCAENNIEYVTDSTNEDTDYTRNHIRHTVIPAMKKINPELVSAVSRMCDGLFEDETFILSRVKEFIVECQDGKADTDGLKALPRAVRVRVYKQLAGQSLDCKAIDACDGLLFKSECGSYVTLSNGIAFKKERGYVHFVSSALLSGMEFSVLLKGRTEIKELGVTVSDEPLSGYEKIYSVKLLKSGIKGDIYIRSKRDGDVITVNGMTKKIKRILCDRHIPSHLRSRIPLICDENGIVALGDLCVRDGCKYRGDGEKSEINFYKICIKDNGGC
ncbi:MAG: tRNA lysidine(34) synthetase TilS [Clostridia bacterium]|nr:tRNA lysidine(34) synthetase TilS [Clostridia bacterium]